MQNCAPGWMGAVHCGQTVAAAAASGCGAETGVPQLTQKTEPGGLMVRQFVQTGPGAAGAE